MQKIPWGEKPKRIPAETSTYSSSAQNHPGFALVLLDLVNAGWVDSLVVAFASVFHVDVQGFADMIIGLIAGRNSSPLVATTLENALEVVGEEVASTQVERELLPGLDKVDPEVVSSEVLCTRCIVIENVVVGKRGFFFRHLLV